MSARFSPCRTWRYTLTRDELLPWTWKHGELSSPPPPTIVFIGLNPSTADETRDDPTIRRCMGFARSWGYPRLVMLNIFALRSTDPKALYGAADAVGPENDDWLAVEAAKADMVVCAWGTHGALHGRGEDVAECLRGINVPLHVLGLTKDGHPKHPLYLRADTKPIAW